MSKEISKQNQQSIDRTVNPLVGGSNPSRGANKAPISPEECLRHPPDTGQNTPQFGRDLRHEDQPLPPTAAGQQVVSKCFLSTEITGATLNGWWNPVNVYWMPHAGAFMAFREPMTVWACRRYGEGRTPLAAVYDLQLQYDSRRKVSP
jgi:hypothetical protein